ncbi:MAG: formyl-CoA transferase [Gammaproteobacteria bacterium]|nr:formyl-CoA transferase [Gammaproteobacteria bacterium]
MKYIFEGLKVIDLASFLAGPGAATLLADYGAEVIKIEPPGGDGYRRLHGNWKSDYNWQLTSRHKLGVSLDILSEKGKAVLYRLLEDADILVTNFRSDQLIKYGLDFETLRQKNDRLISAQVTGYGNLGPDKNRKGYDTTAWFARTGIMEVSRNMDAPPPFPAGGVGDHSTAMALFAAILMALLKREKTGEGSFVETSLAANGCWANGMSLQGAISGFDLGEILAKKSRSPFANVYETRDRRFITLVLTDPERELPRFAEALGRKDWLEDERFHDLKVLLKNRDAVRDIFSKKLKSMYLKDLCSCLDKYDLTYGVVEDLTGVTQDAHLIENGVIVQTESKDPDFEWTIANPIKISNESTRPIFDPPKKGEHTRNVLRQHGYSVTEIDELIEDRVAF